MVSYFLVAEITTQFTTFTIQFTTFCSIKTTNFAHFLQTTTKNRLKKKLCKR
jgi:hypothetical protein